jgi:hypothetical protein
VANSKEPAVKPVAVVKKRRLRAVKEDESSTTPHPPSRPRTLKAAAEVSERDLLWAMREKSAATIDAGVPPHTLAPLLRQLEHLDNKIRLLDAKAVAAAEDAGGAGDEAWDSSVI